jgi:hypothetical protein
VEKTAVRGAPKRRRKEEWREVRVALARPLEEVDATCVARMDEYAPITKQLFSAACMRGLSSRTQVMGLKDAAREAWVADQMGRIDGGRVELVLERLREHKGRGKKRVKALLAHLTRLRDAVDYDAFRAEGLPIGSGEVESAHRTIPQKRLKLPGAWWRPDNINPMLALRVLRRNEWWNDFWREEPIAVAA